MNMLTGIYVFIIVLAFIVLCQNDETKMPNQLIHELTIFRLVKNIYEMMKQHSAPLKLPFIYIWIS